MLLNTESIFQKNKNKTSNICILIIVVLILFYSIYEIHQCTACILVYSS